MICPSLSLAFGHRHRSDRAPPPYDLGHERRQVIDRKRQQHAVPARRIGVDADHRLPVEIFERVGDQARPGPSTTTMSFLPKTKFGR